MIEFDRRTALKIGGGGVLSFLPGLTPVVWSKESPPIFGSAFQDHSGAFGFALFSGDGEILRKYPLPSRGHDLVMDPNGVHSVVFARRPGNFAVAINLLNDEPPKLFQSPQGRHFYGHGCFSKNRKLLYASENDYENAEGKIGVYDSSDGFRRVDEFPSHGMGPHELIIDHAENMIVIANGGIETHPDFGRRKLNLPSMEPSLAYIDAVDGKLIERQVLPSEFSKLSIRHLAFGMENSVLFACQNEGWFPGGDAADQHPLVGVSKRGEGISLFAGDWLEWATYNGYIGSIATSSEGEQFAITSPKGGIVSVFETAGLKLLKQLEISQVSGLAYGENRFSVTSATGRFTELNSTTSGNQFQTDWMFENHMVMMG